MKSTDKHLFETYSRNPYLKATQEILKTMKFWQIMVTSQV
jgi:hypothetical protein